MHELLNERLFFWMIGFWVGAFVASVCFLAWMWGAIAEGEFSSEVEVKDDQVQDAR